METTNLKINGAAVIAPKDTVILEAARLAYIETPILCSLKEINEIGACYICTVGLKNGGLIASCVYPIEGGMEVSIDTSKVLDSRKKTLQFSLSNYNHSCLSRVRSGCCELQELAHELGVEDEACYDGKKTSFKIDYSATHTIRDNNKYILCRRCVAICDNIQGIGVIGANHHGFAVDIGSTFEMGLGETSRVSCGQCTAVCPTGTLTGRDYTGDVSAAIADPARHVIVQTAPAMRAGLGEEFGPPIDTDVEDKMAAALHCLGFDKVFDVSFSADLIIMEEAHESLDRVQNGGVLPLIISCSPGWVRCCEHYFPDMTENLSSYKPPQQMSGAITKSYYAEKAGISPKNIVSVSIMPCAVEKSEIDRGDQDANGVPGVDISITTRESARMIKRSGIGFLGLSDRKFDDPLGPGTGATIIFGATGSVMGAALRAAVEILTDEELPKPDFEEIHSAKGIEEATYDIAGMDIKAAVASGLGNVKELLEKVKSGEADYHFIEIMGCLGGCANGGEQPQQPGYMRNTIDIRGLCAKVLYSINPANPIRRSRENPAIKGFYSTYLGELGNERAHHLLHIAYVKGTINKKIVNEEPNTVIEVGDH